MDQSNLIDNVFSPIEALLREIDRFFSGIVKTTIDNPVYLFTGVGILSCGIAFLIMWTDHITNPNKKCKHGTRRGDCGICTPPEEPQERQQTF
jgi:hypothetical protein